MHYASSRQRSKKASCAMICGSARLCQTAADIDMHL